MQRVPGRRGALEGSGVASATATIDVACYAGDTASAPLVTFAFAASPSARLVSDLNEVRGPTDTETLPAFLVSQTRIKKPQLALDLDDASPAGTLIAIVEGRATRVPTNQPAADPAIYGIWSGSYQRLDAGRELKADVTCYGLL